jgi:truncated hemoglobin YjbI
MSTPDGSACLFERLGGAPAIDAAVGKFYEKVLADDRIKHFFEGVNMDLQAAPRHTTGNRCVTATKNSSTIWV